MQKNITQVHGKLEKMKSTTLEQIWGDTGMSRYKTLDEAQYMSFLTEMNKSDLQTHAVKMGIIPTDNRDLLTRKLIKEFRLFANSFKIPQSASPKSKKVSSTALKILSEGR